MVVVAMLVTVVAAPHSAVPVVASAMIKVICEAAGKVSVAAVHGTVHSRLHIEVGLL